MSRSTALSETRLRWESGGEGGRWALASMSLLGGVSRAPADMSEWCADAITCVLA